MLVFFELILSSIIMQTKTKKAEVNIVYDVLNIRLGPKAPVVSADAFINNRELPAHVTSRCMKVIYNPL